MDEITDFEELIDISFLSVSQRSSQRPISEVLDNMCEAMDKSNSGIDNVLKINDTCNEIENVNENINDVGIFKSIFTSNFLGKSKREDKDETVYSSGNTNEIHNSDLEEFDSILAAKCLYNDCNEVKTNGIITNNEQHVKHTQNSDEIDEIVASNDVIDLKEFEDFLGIEGLDNDSKEEQNEVNDVCDTNNLPEIKNEFSQVPNGIVNDLEEFAEISATDLRNSQAEDKIEISKSNLIDERQIKYETKELSNETVIDLDEFLRQNLYADNDCSGANKCFFNSNSTTTEEINITKIVPYEVPLDLEVENGIRFNVPKQTHTEEIYIISDSDDGYNSSDFEFIAEDEALKAGIITKFDKINIAKNIISSTVNINLAVPSASKTNGKTVSISRNNEASPSAYLKYSKHRYQRCYSRQSPDHHVIPTGEEYLDMFRGEYSPIVVNNLYTMRSKCVLPSVPMADAKADEVMFRNFENVDQCCEKYKNDVDDCLNKILATYPGENRRKRRRH